MPPGSRSAFWPNWSASGCGNVDRMNSNAQVPLVSRPAEHPAQAHRVQAEAPLIRASVGIEVECRVGVEVGMAIQAGDAELRLAPWLAQNPGQFFLATKTGEREYAGVVPV